MTRQAGGNEAVALINAVLGNILGVFLTPLLIYGYLGGRQGSVDLQKVFLDLALTVILPLIVGTHLYWLLQLISSGQITRFIFPNLYAKLGPKWGIINSAMLLVYVWSVFCDMFAAEDIYKIRAEQLLVVLASNVLLYSLFSSIGYFAGKLFGEQIAMMMCVGTKTVALGAPIIQLIYEKAGLRIVPLLVRFFRLISFSGLNPGRHIMQANSSSGVFS